MDVAVVLKPYGHLTTSCVLNHTQGVHIEVAVGFGKAHAATESASLCY